MHIDAELPVVFLKYQQELMHAAETEDVTVIEKSRRTGYSWAMAASAVLTAAASADAGGMDVYYMGYEKDMTREFVGYCGDFAKAVEPAAAAFDESLFKDPENPDKDILTFRTKFGSGFEIVALSSAPRSLRGKQGLIIIDEAAFHDNLDEVVKAAMAFLMWGGRVVIISTHDGDANPFNVLVNDIRSGKVPYHLLRCTLDDAIEDGLFKRICLKTRKKWSADGEVAWRTGIIAKHGSGADEELFCIPSQGSGAYLSAALIEARMKEGIPVQRLDLPGSFLLMAEHLRVAEINDWCEQNLKPVLGTLDTSCPHVFGHDFARKRDLSVFWPLAIDTDLVLRTPFVLEMRNVPHEAQKQILIYIVDRLPRFRAGKMDASGNGSYLAEAMLQKYGERVEPVMLSEPWYRENMPRMKAAYEDGSIVIPKDRDTLDDLRLLKLIRGVGRVPDERTGEKDKKRHGDSAVACVLAVAASKAEPEEFDYQAVPRPGAALGAPRFHETADEAIAADHDDEDGGNDGGFMPQLTRRVYH